VFVAYIGKAADLAAKLQLADSGDLKLRMVSSRGMAVWPEGFAQTLVCDQWRARFQLSKPADSPALPHSEAVALLDRIGKAGLEFIKTEGLYYFDGKPAYQMGQGQK
jgi:isocitrate dehydrogenase